jgi:phytoene desaturase
LNLIPAAHRRHNSDRRIQSLRYSMSCFLLYLGTRRQYPHLAHQTIYMGPRYRGLIGDIFDGHGLPQDFSLYLHAPTRTDPSMALPGGESLYVLAPVPHLGHGVDWEREGDDYRDRIVNFLEHEAGLVGLRDNLVVERRFTPLDFRDRLNSHLGAAFSVEPTLFQSAWFRPHNRSEDVQNLYLVGAGTHPGAGLPGVLLSGQIAANLIANDPSLRTSRRVLVVAGA